MARFSVGGDEDDDEGPNRNRSLPKRLRFSNPIVYSHRRTLSAAAAAAAAASTSNSGSRATPSTVAEVTRPEEPVAAQEESEDHSSNESETSWSDSSSESEQEPDEEEQEPQVPRNQRSGHELRPTEARVDSTPNGNGACRESGVPSGSVSVTLTDPDVLDCPICYEALCSPVYQCENGHIACASCCTTMKNKCASCCWPIGYNRCRAIEKVLESVRITCRNVPYGCTETLSYSKKLAHEKTCTYGPCSCPHTGCGFVGISKCLYGHFALQHTSKQFYFNSLFSILLDNNQKHVFLQDKSHNILFILNRSIETPGSFVNVVCIAPALEKRGFSYELLATIGESSIKLKTSVDSVPKWTAQTPAKMRLLVPNNFISTSGQLKLELIIWRTPSWSPSPPI